MNKVDINSGSLLKRFFDAVLMMFWIYYPNDLADNLYWLPLIVCVLVSAIFKLSEVKP